MQVKLQNLRYGNELSEYDTVQSTVLVDGRRYLTLLCAAWLLCQLATSESGRYDPGIIYVSRVILSTLHWSVLTVYFKRKPPASVYAVRNEQGFRTPGVFSCNAFSFWGSPERFGTLRSSSLSHYTLYSYDTIILLLYYNDIHILYGFLNRQ